MKRESRKVLYSSFHYCEQGFWEKPLSCDNKCSMQELFFLMELESDMEWEKRELIKFKGNVSEADLIVLAFLSVLLKG